jgi:hypothetical protein
MKKLITLLAAGTLIAAASACSKPDTESRAADSARADAALDSAGKDLKAGLGKIGDAASHTADGIEASGKELAKQGKAAAADAASDASTAASKASSKLRD